jgi:dihydroflavonol-4-reductase
MASPRVLVTGGTGFIGSSLIPALIAKGYEVVAVARNPVVAEKEMPAGPSLTWKKGDLTDLESLRSACEGCEGVFHLAGALVGSWESFERTNILGTQNVAEAARYSGTVKHFVYVSSLASGGPSLSDRARTEDDEDAPVSFYGRSKKRGEDVLRQALAGIPLTILRPGIVFGPKDRGVFTLVKTVAGGIIPVIRGVNPSRHKYYSQIFVRDLVDLIILSFERSNLAEFPDRVFYASSDEVMTYSGMVGGISDAIGRKPFTLPVPFWLAWLLAHFGSFASRFSKTPMFLNRDKLNEIRPDFWVCSIERARNELGYSPKYRYGDAMKETVKWYRDQRWIK